MNLQFLATRRDGDRWLPCGIQPVGVLFAAIHERGFNHHRRRLEMRFEIRRIHRCESFDGWKPQSAVGGAAGGGLRAGGTFARRQSVRRAINPAGNDVGRAVAEFIQRILRNAHQAGVRADPQITLIVLGDVTDAVAGKSVFRGIARPFSVPKPRQSVPAGADPQGAVLVRVKTGNVVAGQSVFTGAISSEPSILHKIQALAFRADPQISPGVFRDGTDGVFRKAVASREQFPFLSVEIA